MEGDTPSIVTTLPPRNFNPLPPHGGRLFYAQVVTWYILYFNPLPPHGGRRDAACVVGLNKYISIHSLRMEGDVVPGSSQQYKKVFQSTPSAWRETNLRNCLDDTHEYFNPLPPHGGRRRFFHLHRQRHLSFQSTPSAWRETLILLTLSTIHNYFNPLPPHGGRLATATSTAANIVISIHSLRMEGDAVFYFRHQLLRISIHSLRMEGDTLSPP